VCKALLGDEDGADDDFSEAARLAPDDPAFSSDTRLTFTTVGIWQERLRLEGVDRIEAGVEAEFTWHPCSRNEVKLETGDRPTTALLTQTTVEACRRSPASLRSLSTDAR